jgi:Polyphenol oxidase middle domain
LQYGSALGQLEQWGGQNPGTQEFLSQKFTFVGPNSGLMDVRVSDCLSTSQLGYQYATLEKRPTKRVAKSIAGFSSTPTPNRIATKVRLGASATRITLRRSSGSEGTGTLTAAIPSAQFVALIVKGLQTNVQPQSLYEVFLNLPESAGNELKRSHLAGTINFFEAQNRLGALRSFVLDVSQLAREILTANNEPTVTIYPVETPSKEAEPMIGEISLAALK